MISIYADGSSTGRADGPGGYGWIIVRGTQELAWGYGGSPRTTNNLMEMEGAIQGLEAVLELVLHQGPELLELVSDSQYTLGIASGGYSPVKNLESAKLLKSLAAETGCRFRWVRGHIGDVYNEKCDVLAKQGKTEHTDAAQLEKEARKKNRARSKKSTP